MEIIEFLKTKNKEEYDFSEDWKIGYMEDLKEAISDSLDKNSIKSKIGFSV